MSLRWTLKDKTAIITGATKGIGAAITKEFLELGAEVLIAARNKSEVNQVVQLWQRDGYKVHGIAADVSSAQGRTTLIYEAEQLWSKVDILINNVGTNVRKKTLEYSEQEFDFLINTNLRSTFELSKLAFPLLQQSEQGNIINISSVAGLNHLRTGAIYGMTKAAINQLTKNLAVEWAPFNIRVNAIAPWYISTPLAQTVLKDEAYLQAVLDRTPMKKIGNPEDVAAAAAFLCMPASAFTTGQCLAIDGGFSIYGF